MATLLFITTKAKERKMKKLFQLSTIAFVFTITMGFFLNDANAEDFEFTVTSYLVNVQFVACAGC